MRSSSAAATSLRERAAHRMGGTIVSVQEWEVGVMHRDHRVGAGAWCRTAWLRTEPATRDWAIDLFKHGVLPGAGRLDGFCSAAIRADVAREIGLEPRPPRARYGERPAARAGAGLNRLGETTSPGERRVESSSP